jgi:hypothetical protein
MKNRADPVNRDKQRWLYTKDKLPNYLLPNFDPNSPYNENLQNLQKMYPMHSRVPNLYKNKPGFKDSDMPMTGQDQIMDPTKGANYNFSGTFVDPFTLSNAICPKDLTMGDSKSFRDALYLCHLQEHEQFMYDQKLKADNFNFTSSNAGGIKRDKFVEGLKKNLSRKGSNVTNANFNQGSFNDSVLNNFVNMITR